MRISRKHGLPTTAAQWLRIAALTLHLAVKTPPPLAMADIQKQLKDLVRDFERLSRAIGSLDPEIEWELDLYTLAVDAETGAPTFGATADPGLTLFKQTLDVFLDRARAIRLSRSGGGRRKALHTMALWGLASHLREVKPEASARDLARLAQDLFDPILPAKQPPPAWPQHARKLWPKAHSSRTKSR
jgi:hypothetical protein